MYLLQQTYLQLDQGQQLYNISVNLPKPVLSLWAALHISILEEW